MNSRQPTPADGDGDRKGSLDGVSGAPGGTPGEGVGGRSPSGETGGGAYPLTGTTASDTTDGDHGGQSENKYYGGGQAGGEGNAAPNSVAGSNEADAGETKLAPPSADRPSRTVEAGGRSFEVVEDSGVAAAEAAGRVRPDGADEPKDSSKLAG